MATIKARARADGSTGYTAIIRIKRHGQIIHQEAKTFSRRALAVDWGKRRELELEGPGAVERAKMGETSVGALIKRYVEEFAAVSKWQRSKGADLKRLLGEKIADENALELTPQRLIMHVRERRAGGAGPATALNDLVWIGVVLRTAAAVWGLPVPADAAHEARAACTQLRLVGKSRQRTRTPTYDELVRLDEYFQKQDRRSEIPMRHVMWFAIYSGRREAEIARLLREDNDPDRKTGVVRDAKHPTAKEGNHRMFRYTPEAWAIMEMQPNGGEGGRIFPFEPDSIGARFTRACKMLEIADLRFHDLRHEATTRLFERGLTIPEVAAHTLHESWAVLKRYTHLVKRGRVYEAPFLPRAGGQSAPQDPSPTPATEPSGSRP